MFAAQTARMERQKEALTRLLMITHEAVAALSEIAECDDLAPDEHNATVVYLKERAKSALVTIEGLREAAAAAEPDTED